MIHKIIILLASTILWADAMDYTHFKQQVLKHSKILQSNRLAHDAAKTQEKIMLLQDNPTLELEASRFRPDIGDGRYGYRGAYSQSIRTPGYDNALSQKASATAQLQRAYATQGRAGFFRELEHLYTAYVFKRRRYAQLKQEYTISNKIAAIAKERFQGGAQSRAQYIQAKTDALTVKTEIIAAKREMQTIYYRLLSLAGMEENTTLSSRFIYPVSSVAAQKNVQSPQSKILEAKEENFLSDTRINTHTIQKVTLFGEFENEPDQNIGRVGISLPLPIFNDNSEKRMLAKLQHTQAKLQKEQLLQSQRLQRRSLHSAITQLVRQYRELQRLEKEQKELMRLFEEGYRISKGSLLDLLLTKKKWVATQKALLDTARLINDQKIELNYLQGRYND